jgi:hypothetical protein
MYTTIHDHADGVRDHASEPAAEPLLAVIGLAAGRIVVADRAGQLDLIET